MDKLKQNLKVLVISYDYYPDTSPNTYRWKCVLEAWIKKGIKIYVVSAMKNGFSEFDVINGVEVYRPKSSF